MDAFPAFFPLAGARVVIAGSGEPAEARARLLAGSPAEIVRLEGEAAFDPAAYAGARLVFIAAFNAEFAQRAAAAARAGPAPVNVFDRPALSDFNTPAIVDRGAVVAAVATSGAAPLLAQMLRAELEARVDPDVGRVAALLGARREAIRAAFPDLADRRAFLRRILAEPLDAEALDAALDRRSAPPTPIDLIEAPPAEDLLSLRAARALGAAEVVVAPAEARALVDRHARRDAERLAPDRAEAGRLASLAAAGRPVVVVAAEPHLIAALTAAGAGLRRHRPAPDGS